MSVRPLLSAGVALLSLPLSAQPPDRVELFGQTGLLWLGGYEQRSQDLLAAYGGSVTLPVWRKWAVDVSVVTATRGSSSQTLYRDDLRLTRIAPALAYRFGSSRLSGFVGGGVGLELERRRFRFGLPGWEGSEFGEDLHTPFLFSRGGVVWNPTSRFLIRGDVEVAFQSPSPDVTARIGVGWRF